MFFNDWSPQSSIIRISNEDRRLDSLLQNLAANFILTNCGTATPGIIYLLPLELL